MQMEAASAGFVHGQSENIYGRSETGLVGGIYDGKRIRKAVQRRSVDYSSTMVRYIQKRQYQRDVRDATLLQATSAAVIDLLPPVAYEDTPAALFATKFVHSSTNKVRCSINQAVWTPSGRRLITGSQSGEFTLWNGQSFNFEMILQAHDVAVRAMVWSHNDNWMVTGDDSGFFKYWQANMNNVKATKAHKEAVRDLSFSPTDLKLASCSDDTTVKIWDFARCQEEHSLSGHGWDVKSVDWHPQKSLLASGAKDNLVKLWDPKAGRELCTLHGHKNTVLALKWNSNGNWLLSSSRDQLIKLFDIRMLRELETYRGHKKDVTSLAWHPFQEDLFASGCHDGAINHWLVGREVPAAEVAAAHDGGVLDLAWHPVGHLLCSGSSDHSTKFWSRLRPGEGPKDRTTWASDPNGNASEAATVSPEGTKIGAAIPGLGPSPPSSSAPLALSQKPTPPGLAATAQPPEQPHQSGALVAVGQQPRPSPAQSALPFHHGGPTSGAQPNAAYTSYPPRPQQYRGPPPVRAPSSQNASGGHGYHAGAPPPNQSMPYPFAAVPYSSPRNPPLGPSYGPRPPPGPPPPGQSTGAPAPPHRPMGQPYPTRPVYFHQQQVQHQSYSAQSYGPAVPPARFGAPMPGTMSHPIGSSFPPQNPPGQLVNVTGQHPSMQPDWRPP